jgi:hypothetical protein
MQSAADLVLRMATHFTNSDLLGALLLEKATYTLCQCPRPQLRKATLYLMLAARKYDQSGLALISLQHHRLLLALFNTDGGFSLAIHHIKVSLARNYFHVGRLREATQSLSQLLLAHDLSSNQQAAYFHEIAFMYQASRRIFVFHIDHHE